MFRERIDDSGALSETTPFYALRPTARARSYGGVGDSVALINSLMLGALVLLAAVEVDSEGSLREIPNEVYARAVTLALLAGLVQYVASRFRAWPSPKHARWY